MGDGWLWGQQLKGHRSELQYLHSHAGETYQELAPQEGSLQPGVGLVQGNPVLWGRWDQRSRGLSTGHMARKPSRLLGAQAVGIILSLVLNKQTLERPVFTWHVAWDTEGHEFKTESEMLFPGCEKSGLVTPNSTDCAIPNGFGGGGAGRVDLRMERLRLGADIAVLSSSGVLLQTLSRSFMAMGPSVPIVRISKVLVLLAYEGLES